MECNGVHPDFSGEFMSTINDFIKQHPAMGPLLALGVLAVCTTDSLTQLGFAHGVLYTPLVVLASLSSRSQLIHLTSLLSLTGLWLGYVISPAAPDGFATVYILANRWLATLAIFLLWWLGLLASNAQKEQEHQQTVALQTTEDLRYARVVASLSHWQFDDHRKVIHLDQASQTLLGVTEPELTLEQFAQCFADKSQATIKHNVQDTLKLQQVTLFETQLNEENSNRLWLNIIAYPDPVYPEQIRGLLQNTEQLHQKTDMLVEQQLRFIKLADSMPVKVWTATAAGVVDFVSLTFVEFCGKSTTSIVQDWLSLIHPDDRDSTLKQWQYAVASKIPYKIEFRILRADGVYCWHLTSALPIYNASGEHICWFGSAMDISEQKALWLKADQMRQSLYQTLESITDGFFSLDKDFRFTYFNQSAADLFAYNKQPALGKLLTEICYAPNKDFSLLTTTVQRAFYKQQTEQFLFVLPDTAMAVLFSVYPAEQGVSVLMQPQAVNQQNLGLIQSATAYRLTDD